MGFKGRANTVEPNATRSAHTSRTNRAASTPPEYLVVLNLRLTAGDVIALSRGDVPADIAQMCTEYLQKEHRGTFRFSLL